MSAFTSKPAKWLYSRVRSRNIFKQSVSLTYKDKADSLNFLGGISTILIVLFIIVYGILMTMKLQRRSDVQWNQNFIEIDSKTANQTFKVTEDDDIEVMFMGRIMNSIDLNFSYTNLNEILEIEAHVSRDLQNEGIIRYIKPIECNTTRFNDIFTDPNLIVLPKWCYKIKDQEFVKSLNSAGGETFTFTFFLCKTYQAFYCHNTEFMKKASETIEIFMYGRTKYVDLSDIDDPIKSEIKYRGTWNLANYENKYTHAELIPHEVTLEDTLWFYFKEPDPIKFLKLPE